MSIHAGFAHSCFVDDDGALWITGTTRATPLAGPVQQRNLLLSPIKWEMCKIVRLESTNFHTLFIDNTGAVYACGSNVFGQLGLGDSSSRNEATQIALPFQTQSIHTAASHSVFIDNNGGVWVCGGNFYGQLGLGNTTQQLVVQKLEKCIKKKLMGFGKSSMPQIRTVSTLGYHTLFLDVNGNVWACGRNKHGQLGLDDNRHRSSPEKASLPTILQISAGHKHSIFLEEDGSVWVCGRNNCGQLGLGQIKKNVSQIMPEKLKNIPPIIKIKTGQNFTFLIDAENFVWVFGQNNHGQLGTGDTIERDSPTKLETPQMEDVSCGGYHTLFLDFEGNVWACGFNGTGQLGVGGSLDDGAERTVLTKVLNIPTFQVSINPDKKSARNV